MDNAVTKITFEDRGQDFIDWYIRNDVVIDCQPHQGKVWVGSKIQGPLQIGKHPKISARHSPEHVNELNYKVESLTVLNEEQSAEVEGYGKKWAGMLNIEPAVLGL
ncbi:MAG: hypothetical protein RSD49_18285 [Hafnia sp.]